MDDERLKRKAEEGVGNVVTAMLDHPTVKKAITEHVVKQSLESAIFFSMMFFGAFNMYNAAKTVWNWSPIVDLIISFPILIIGVFYMLRKWR